LAIKAIKNKHMELKIIKTKKQYQEYLDWIDKQFDKKVKPDSPQGEKGTGRSFID
jgi:hypothetical protein